jgi:hypothetical protein
MESQGLIIVSSECSNCGRFLEALNRVKNHGFTVADYSALTPLQKSNIQAVPTVILNSGKRLVGTNAFTWLSETYYASLEPAGYGGFDNCELSFSSVNDSVGYCMTPTGYADL